MPTVQRKLTVLSLAAGRKAEIGVVATLLICRSLSGSCFIQKFIQELELSHTWLLDLCELNVSVMFYI